jgi:hypothetical protein
MARTEQRRLENEAIIAKWADEGVEALSANGGFFVRDRGWVTLAQARKETGINMAAKRQARGMISAYGDWAWVAAINRVK